MTVDHESQQCFVSTCTSIWTLLLLRLPSLPIYSTCSTVNMKHYASVVGNRGEKHAYACYACSLLFHSSNDLWSRQDSGFPQDFFIFIFIFHFHVSHSRQDSRYDHHCACALVPSRFSSSKAKSTPWQVVSAPQRLTLEIQYSLPTYPQAEQGWDFPEVVLWHVNLQIMW